MQAASQGEWIALRDSRSALFTGASLQSVLSVLSRSTTSQNILRLDMEIQDPSRGLQGKKNVQNRLRDDGQSSEDEHATSREARLILKLICKHGN
jgi:hypothetical protein